MKNTGSIEPELSRPLLVDKISAGGIFEHVVAAPDERQALCLRFGLLELSKLEAELNIDHMNQGGMIAVTGKIEADVVQQCVITLEPVKSHINEAVDVIYAPASMMKGEDGVPTHNDVAEEDFPEPIENGVIDLGELVSQQLAISLPPYPRAPGAVMPFTNNGDDGKNTPFAVLKKLNIKKKK